MSGSIRPSPYAFMTCSGTDVPYHSLKADFSTVLERNLVLFGFRIFLMHATCTSHPFLLELFTPAVAVKGTNYHSSCGKRGYRFGHCKNDVSETRPVCVCLSVCLSLSSGRGERCPLYCVRPVVKKWPV